MARGGYTDSHPEKKIKRAQRGVDALSKRPVAVTFEPVEWHKFTVDNMSLGTSLTPINWTADDSEMDTFISPLDDAEHNTWELNAGDLEIWKDGAYDLQLSAFGITTNPNVDTVLFMSFVRITGPNPETARGSGINWFPNWIIRHDEGADGNSDWSQHLAPEASINFTLRQGDIVSGGNPLKIEISAYFEEDGTGVAKTPDFGMYLRRIGPSFQSNL